MIEPPHACFGCAGRARTHDGESHPGVETTCYPSHHSVSRVVRGQRRSFPTGAHIPLLGRSPVPSSSCVRAQGVEEEQRLHLKRQVEELEGKNSEREKHDRERALAIK